MARESTLTARNLVVVDEIENERLMLLPKMILTTSLLRFTTGLPELPPMMSAVPRN